VVIPSAKFGQYSFRRLQKRRMCCGSPSWGSTVKGLDSVRSGKAFFAGETSHTWCASQKMCFVCRNGHWKSLDTFLVNSFAWLCSQLCWRNGWVLRLVN
jgi:hypothetical protein